MKMPKYMKLSKSMAKHFKMSKRERRAVNARRQKMFEDTKRKYRR